MPTILLLASTNAAWPVVTVVIKISASLPTAYPIQIFPFTCNCAGYLVHKVFSKYLFQVEHILQGSKLNFNVTGHTKVQQERSRQQGTAHGMHSVNDDIIHHVILQYAWTTLCSAAGQTPRQHGETSGIHSVWCSP